MIVCDRCGKQFRHDKNGLMWRFNLDGPECYDSCRDCAAIQNKMLADAIKEAGSEFRDALREPMERDLGPVEFQERLRIAKCLDDARKAAEKAVTRAWLTELRPKLGEGFTKIRLHGNKLTAEK